MFSVLPLADSLSAVKVGEGMYRSSATMTVKLVMMRISLGSRL